MTQSNINHATRNQHGMNSRHALSPAVAKLEPKDAYEKKVSLENINHISRAKITSKIKNMLYGVLPLDSQKITGLNDVELKEKLHHSGVYKINQRLEEISVAKWADKSFLGLARNHHEKTRFDLSKLYNSKLMCDTMARDMALSKQNIQFQTTTGHYNLCPKLVPSTDGKSTQVRWFLVKFDPNNTKKIITTHVSNSFDDILIGVLSKNKLLEAKVVRQHSFGTLKNIFKKSINIKNYHHNPQILKIISNLDMSCILNEDQTAQVQDGVNYNQLRQTLLFIGGYDILKDQQSLQKFILNNAASIAALINNPNMSMNEMRLKFFRSAHANGALNLQAYDLNSVTKATGENINKRFSSLGGFNKRSNGDAVLMQCIRNLEMEAFEDLLVKKEAPIELSEPAKNFNVELIKAYHPAVKNAAPLPIQNMATIKSAVFKQDSHKARPILLVRGKETFQLKLINGLVYAASLRKNSDEKGFALGKLDPITHVQNFENLSTEQKKAHEKSQIDQMQKIIKNFQNGKSMHLLLDTSTAQSDIKRDILRFSDKVKIKNATASLMGQAKRDMAEWSCERKAKALESLTKMDDAREKRHNSKIKHDKINIFARCLMKLNYFSSRYTSTRELCSHLSRAVMNGEDFYYRFWGHLFAGATQPQDTLPGHAVRAFGTTPKSLTEQPHHNFNQDEMQFVLGWGLDATFQVLADEVQLFAANSYIAQSKSVIRGKAKDYGMLRDESYHIQTTVRNFCDEAQKIQEKLSKAEFDELKPEIVFQGKPFNSREKLLKFYTISVGKIVEHAAAHSNSCGSKSDFNLSKFVLEQLSQNLVRMAWLATVYAGAPAILAHACGVDGTHMKRLPDLAARRVLQSLAGGLDNFMRFNFIAKDHANKPTQIMAPIFQKYKLDIFISKLPSADIDKMISEVVSIENLNVTIPQSNGTYLELNSHQIQALYRLTHDAGSVDDQKMISALTGDSTAPADLLNLWKKTRASLIYDLDGLRSIRQEYSTQRIAIAKNIIDQEAGSLQAEMQWLRTIIESYTKPDGKNYISATDSATIRLAKEQKLAEFQHKYNKLTQKMKDLEEKALLFARGLAYLQSESKNKFDQPDLSVGATIDPQWKNAWDEISFKFPDSSIDKALRTGGEEWLRSTKLILKNFSTGMKAPNEFFMETIFRMSHAPIWALTVVEEGMMVDKLGTADKLESGAHEVNQGGTFSIGGSMIQCLSFSIGISSSVGMYFKNMNESNYNWLGSEGLQKVTYGITRVIGDGNAHLKENEKKVRELEAQLDKLSFTSSVDTSDTSKPSAAVQSASIKQKIKALNAEHREMRIEIAKLLSLYEYYGRQQENRRGALALLVPIKYDSATMNALQNGNISDEKLNDLISSSSDLAGSLQFDSPAFVFDSSNNMSSIQSSHLSDSNKVQKSLMENICTHFSNEMAAIQVKALQGDPYQFMNRSIHKRKKGVRGLLDSVFLKPKTRSVRDFYDQSVLSVPEDMARKLKGIAHGAWRRGIMGDKFYEIVRSSKGEVRDKAAMASKTTAKIDKIREEIIGSCRSPQEVLEKVMDSLYLYQEGSREAKNMGRERDGMTHLRMQFIAKAESDLRHFQQEIIDLRAKKNIGTLDEIGQKKLDNTIYLEEQYRNFMVSEKVLNFKAYHRPFQNSNLVSDERLHQFFGNTAIEPTGSYALRYANAFPTSTIPDWNEGTLGKAARGLSNNFKLIGNTLNAIISPNHRAGLLVNLFGVWYKDHFLWTRVIKTVAALPFAIAQCISFACTRDIARRSTQEIVSNDDNQKLLKDAKTSGTHSIDEKINEMISLTETYDPNKYRDFVGNAAQRQNILIELSGVLLNNYEGDNADELQLQSSLKTAGDFKMIHLMNDLKESLKLRIGTNLGVNSRHASAKKYGVEGDTANSFNLESLLKKAIAKKYGSSTSAEDLKIIYDKTIYTFYLQIGLEEMREKFIEMDKKLAFEVQQKILEVEKWSGRRLLPAEEEAMRRKTTKSFKEGRYMLELNDFMKSFDARLNDLEPEFHSQTSDLTRACFNMYHTILGDPAAYQKLKQNYIRHHQEGQSLRGEIA